MNQVMLSPEGNTLDEMKALTRALLADGLPTVLAHVSQSVGRTRAHAVRAVAGGPGRRS